MKKTALPFFSTLLGCLLLFSCQQDKPKGNVALTGHIEGLKQGTLYIQKVSDTTFVTIDSVRVHGNSSFKRYFNVDSPEVFYLTLDRGNTQSQDNQLQFFVEPGNISIETSLQNFFADAKISGSESQDIYNQYLKTRSLIIDRQNELYVALMNAELSNDNSQRDSLSELYKKTNARLFLNAINFALNHKSSHVAPYIALTELYDRQVKYLDTIQNALPPAVSEGHYGQQLKAYIEERKKAEANAVVE